jgi:hypothetical protein
MDKVALVRQQILLPGSSLSSTTLLVYKYAISFSFLLFLIMAIIQLSFSPYLPCPVLFADKAGPNRSKLGRAETFVTKGIKNMNNSVLPDMQIR